MNSPILKINVERLQKNYIKWRFFIIENPGYILFYDRKKNVTRYIRRPVSFHKFPPSPIPVKSSHPLLTDQKI